VPQFRRVVSRRVPITAARSRAKIRSCGICGGQSGTREGFLRVLRFPLPILIPPTASHNNHLSSGAGAMRQLVADVTNGLSLTPPQGIKKGRELVKPFTWGVV
jgi:hypothetical protein